MSLSKASPTAPQSLRFVSHQLTSSHAAYPYGSTGNHTRTVPTSHPAFDLPSAASSSTSSPAASHPEHAVHAIAQFRVGDDDTSASGPSSCLIVARAVEQGCTLQVSILPLQPDGDAAFRPASTSQTQSTHALTSTQPQPQLFLFPAPLLPSVSIFVDHDTRRLYIIAVTVTGWLYRLAFALPHSIYASSYPYDWVTEHQIAALAAYAPSSVTSPSPSGRAPSQSTVSTADFGPRTPTMVHAPHPGLVVVACRDGTLIKMEQADSAEGPFKGPWRESCLRPSSFFKNISKLFSRSAQPSPAVASLPNESSSSPTHVASLAGQLDGSASGLGFCLSRDRKLRIWNFYTGSCLRTIDLPTGLIDPHGSDSQVAAVASPGSSASSSSSVLPPLGIEGPTRPLIQTFTPPQQDGEEYAYDLYLLAFVPAPLPSGSFFAFYGVELLEAPSGSQGDASVGEVALLWQKRCDEESRGLRAELRDAAVLPTGATGATDQWTLWSLWDAGGKSMVKHTVVNLDDEDAIDVDAQASDSARDSWTTIEHNPSATYTALHGADLDLALSNSATEDIPPTFLSRIFEAGRYSPASLEWALDTYAASLRATLDAARMPIPPALQEGASFLSLAQQIAATVGSGVVLETDPQTGALGHEQFRSDLRREWRRFVGLLDEIDAQGRWPIGLVVPDEAAQQAGDFQTPLVMMRDRIVALAGEDLADVAQRLSTAASALAASKAPGRGHARGAVLPERLTSALVLAIREQVGADRQDLAGACWELIQVAGSLAQGVADHQLAAMVAERDRIASQPLEADVLELATALWDDYLQEHVGEGVAEAVREKLEASNQSTLEPALWALADLLVAPSSTHTATTTAQQLPTQLAASFVADGTYQTLRARLFLARALFALVLFIFATQTADDDSIASAFQRLPYLVVRCLSVQHELSVLVQIADRPGVRELSPDSDGGPAIELEDPEDAVTAQLKRLTVGGAGGVHAVGERPGASLLHYALLNGLVSLSSDDGREDGSPAPYCSALASAITSVIGSLGLPPMRGSAWATAIDTELPRLPLPLLLLAHRLLSRGFPTAALHIVESYPPSPASAYVVARAQLQIQQPGAPERAAEAFEAVLPGLLQLLPSAGDVHESGLRHILPASLRSVEAEAALVARYYRHVVDMFEKAGADAQIADFSRLALQTARLARSGAASSPPLDNLALRDLSFKLFRSELSLQRYASCYATMMDMDDVDALLRRDCLRTLISVMCEAGRVDELLSYSFSGLQVEVERNLSFKARNSDPTAPGPNYYEILYSYHVRRGDYTSAGAVMYQQAHRLAQIQRSYPSTFAAGSGAHAPGHLSAAAETFRDLSIQQARSYLASMNALALLDSKNAWFADAVAASLNDDDDDDDAEGARKQRTAGANRGGSGNGNGKLTRYIPAEYWQSESKQLRIIQQEDIRREYHLVLARLELVGMYPELASGTSSLSPTDAVALFVRNDHFERAFATARALGVDQRGIFTALTLRCAATSFVEEERRRARAERSRAMDPDGTNAATDELLEALGGGEDLLGEDVGDRDAQDDEGGEDAEDSAGAEAWAFLRSCDRTAAWSGSPSTLAWRYLKLNLDISDASPAAPEPSYHRGVVLERLLTLSPTSTSSSSSAQESLSPDKPAKSAARPHIPVPHWLTAWFEAEAPEALVRAYMKAGLIDDALRAATAWIRAANRHLAGVTDIRTVGTVAASQRGSSSSTSAGGGSANLAGRYIPYLLIDSLIKMGSDPDLRPARGSASASATRALAEELKSEVVQRRVGVLEGKWREGCNWGREVERRKRGGGAGRGGEGEMEWDEVGA